jgi:hypothetical protein
MANKHHSEFLSFSINEEALQALDTIFSQARTDVEKQVRDIAEQRYQSDAEELHGQQLNEDYRERRMRDLAARRDDEVRDHAKVVYEIALSDGTRNLKRNSFREVLDFQNIGKSAIKTISVNVGKYDSMSLNVELGLNSGYGDNFDYRLSGDEKAIMYYGDRIESWATTVRPWYWRLHKLLSIPFTYFIIGPVITIFVLGIPSYYINSV